MKLDPESLEKLIASNSSSSVGGGLSTYSNPQGDYTAAIVNNTRTIALTLPNGSQLGTVTVANLANGSVTLIKADGTKSNVPLGHISITADVITLPDAEAVFVTGDIVVVCLVGPEKQINFRKLTKTNDEVTNHPVGLTPVNLSASGAVLAVPGRFRGFFVNSFAATATLKLWDNPSAGSGTVVNNTITIDHNGYYEAGNAIVGNGLYATIAVAALDVTFYVEAN